MALLHLGKVLGRPDPELAGVAQQLEPLVDAEATADWLQIVTEPETEVSALENLVVNGLANLVIAIDVPPAALDLFFRFRLVQLLSGLTGRDTTLMIVLPAFDAVPAPGQFYRRARGSWAFSRTLFVCPEPTSATAYTKQLGVTVHAVAQDETVHIVEALARGEDIGHPFFSTTLRPGQTVAIQMQPVWNRCGSSTAFENELEALVDAGHFVVHAFVPDWAVSKPNAALRARYEQSRRETSEHTGAHVACLVCQPNRSQRPAFRLDDAGREFHSEVLARSGFSPSDRLAGAAMNVAKVAIVNHVINLPLAIKLCPDARVVLDMHDYFCRNAYERSRLGAVHNSFASLRSLRRLLQTEVALWNLADVCTAVSHSELDLLRRRNAPSALVLPRPYVERIKMPGQGAAEYDALIVADQNQFNISSLKWFLDEVWRPHLLPHDLRLAIAGRAVKHINTSAYRDGRIAFLGFVDDLEALRGRCLVTVAPDINGTGISIKALTVLAAGHPLVATPTALRGYDPDIVARLPAYAGAEDLATDLVNLAHSAEARAERIAIGDAVFRDLTSTSFTSVLSQVAQSIRHTPKSRQDTLKALLSEATSWLSASRFTPELLYIKLRRIAAWLSAPELLYLKLRRVAARVCGRCFA